MTKNTDTLPSRPESKHLDGSTDRISRQWLDEVLKRIGSQGFNIPDGMLGLLLVGHTKPLLYEIKDSMTIGRKVPGSQTPAIDLGTYQATQQGISRNHAVLELANDKVSIRDLKSTNGTWVNEMQLKPETDYELKNKDMLRFGQFVCFIHLPEGV